MKKNKGWFKKGFDKRRTGFQKGHPSYVTENTINKSRERFKDNNPMRNKNIKNKWLNSMKQKVWNNKERNKKISENQKGKKHSKGHIRKLSLSHLGYKPSKESREKNRIKQIELMKIPANREKRRIAKQKQILLNGGARLGKNEKQILDRIAKIIGYKIIRQFVVKGYFVDGYIPELNRVYEVDEIPKITERDIQRENIIKQELNCEIRRIKDY